MTLDDLLRAGGMYFSAEALSKEYVDSNGNLKVIPSNGNLPRILQGLNVPEAVLDMTLEGVRTNPGVLADMIKANQTQGKRNVVQAVRTNYGAILNAIPSEILMDIALRIPDKGKRFYKLAKKLEEKKDLKGEDVESVRKGYMETFDTPALKAFISAMGDDFIKKYAERYVAFASAKFIEENLSRKVKTREGTELRPDKKKIEFYLNRTIGSYDAEDARNDAYLEIGRGYVSHRMHELAEAA